MKSSRSSAFFQKAPASGSGRYWWLLPFFSFVVGYLITGHFIQKREIPSPSVIGKPLTQAVELLSEHHLGARMLAQREEPTLPEATVLDQLPKPGQKVRPNQCVFLTLSTKQPPQQTPDYWGKRIKEVLPLLEKQGMQVTLISLKSSYPQGMCMGQVPTMGQPQSGKAITLFVSTGPSGLAIMPSFHGLSVPAFEALLEHKDIRVEYVHAKPVEDGHECSVCTIDDQQPAPGAIIDLGRTLHVQVKLAGPAPVPVSAPFIQEQPAQPEVDQVPAEMPMVAESTSDTCLT